MPHSGFAGMTPEQTPMPASTNVAALITKEMSPLWIPKYMPVKAQKKIRWIMPRAGESPVDERDDGDGKNNGLDDEKNGQGGQMLPKRYGGDHCQVEDHLKEEEAVRSFSCDRLYQRGRESEGAKKDNNRE